MVSVIVLNVVMLSVIMLNDVMLCIIMLSVDKLSVIMLNVVMLSVIMINVVILSVVAPFVSLQNKKCFDFCSNWLGKFPYHPCTRGYTMTNLVTIL